MPCFLLAEAAEGTESAQGTPRVPFAFILCKGSLKFEIICARVYIIAGPEGTSCEGCQKSVESEIFLEVPLRSAL
jgi:hypothetical protein